MKLKQMGSVMVILLMVLSTFSIALAQEDLVDETALDELVDELNEEELEDLEEELEEEESIDEAEEELANEDPGATRGLGLGLKKLRERINLAFTFNDEAKAEKRLRFARQRLVEARAAAEEGDTDAVQDAAEAHAELLERVDEANFDDVANPREALRKFLVHKTRLRNHLAEIEATADDLSEEEAERLRAAIERLEERCEEILERIRARLKAAESLSDEEVDAIIDQIEDEIELDVPEDATPEEKLERMISRVEDIIAKGRERIENAEPENDVQEARLRLASASLDEAEDLLSDAREHMAAEEWRAAYADVKAAQRLALSPVIRSRLHAAAEDEERREEIKERIEERHEEIRDRLEEKREEIREHLEEIREESGDEDRSELKRRLIVRDGDFIGRVDTRVERDGDELRRTDRIRIRTPEGDIRGVRNVHVDEDEEDVDDTDTDDDDVDDDSDDADDDADDDSDDDSDDSDDSGSDDSV